MEPQYNVHIVYKFVCFFFIKHVFIIYILHVWKTRETIKKRNMDLQTYKPIFAE